MVGTAVVAFLGGYLADRSSGRPFIVGFISVLAFAATSIVLYTAVFIHVLRRTGHEAHWTPQVFQYAPDYAGAEFDLWSNCTHELFSARPDVVEPDGRRVRGMTNEVPSRVVTRGGYLSGGSFPAHYPDAAPVDFGLNYTVVWTAKRHSDSSDVEIARQEFRLPIAARRLVGTGEFRPPPLPEELGRQQP